MDALVARKHSSEVLAFKDSLQCIFSSLDTKDLTVVISVPVMVQFQLTAGHRRKQPI